MPTAKELLAAAEKDEQVPQVTGDIRERRHASSIQQGLDTVESLHKQYPGIASSRLRELSTACTGCNLLAKEYPRILSKALEHPNDIPTLRSMVGLLASVETGQHTQHSASMVAGTILKEKYIDPIIHPADAAGPVKKLTYAQWKDLAN
jgi:hypothetical protein